MKQIVTANRMNNVPKSFIREILKATESSDIISFAGGLPNKDLFPIEEIQEATLSAFKQTGNSILQYSTTEGYLPLREYIARRYEKKWNLKINPRNIIITNGSQQAIDLLGKILINENDPIIIEEPGYLGAIQAFSVYQPQFLPIPLHTTGIDLSIFSDAIKTYNPKLFYCIPNFQNPSGICYSEETKKTVAQLISESNTYIIEDDPYGELRYFGTDKLSFANFLPDQTILLGSFSKTVVPGFRIGWIVVPDELLEKFVIAKQATDLHSNIFSQHILYQYLTNNDLDVHITKIKNAYCEQCNTMADSITKFLTPEVTFNKPDGGMFFWLTFPAHISTMKLLEKCIPQKITFVPGDSFYINRTNINTCRLNFTCSSPQLITEGIKRLATTYKTNYL